MPFKFEKSRIFDAGISLRRIRESSGAVVVIDNDAFLDNNPDLTISQCYDLTNQAIFDTISSLYQTEFNGDLNLLGVGRPDRDSVSASAMDSLAMLLDSADVDSVRRTSSLCYGRRQDIRRCNEWSGQYGSDQSLKRII